MHENYKFGSSSLSKQNEDHIKYRETHFNHCETLLPH